MLKNLIPLLVVCFLASCSSSEVVLKSEKSIIIDKVGFSEVSKIAEDVADIFSDYEQVTSRSSDPIEQSNRLNNTEKAIAEKCLPLVEQGQEVRQQMIQLQLESECNNNYVLNENSMVDIVNMTDDQLALLALQLNVLSEYQEMIADENQKIISSNVYIDCALQATGITNIIDIIKVGVDVAGGGASIGLIVKGTKIIINAKTMSKLLYGFALRYVGWIGVGITLYDYISCVNSNKS